MLKHSKSKKIFTTAVCALFFLSQGSGVLSVFAAPESQNATLLKEGVALNNTINAPVLKASTTKLGQEVKITNSKSLITLSLRDSDVRQVLRMFADKAGMNIIFHDSVKGQVTMDLVDVNLNDAFALVMKATNMSFWVNGKTLMVASGDAAKELNYSRDQITSIPVKYIDASSVAEFLNKNIYGQNTPGISNSQIAVVNPRTNEIMIFGSDNDVKVAQKILDKMDKPEVVTTFNVVHTTPKEMAQLICDTFINKAASSQAVKDALSSGSGANSMDKITMGGGSMACRSAAPKDGGALASLHDAGLSVAFFPQHGNITLFGGSPYQINAIKGFVAEHDKKQPMAYVEVSVIELNETGTKEFSNSWSLGIPGFGALQFNSSSGLITNPISPFFLLGDKLKVLDPNDPTKVKYEQVKYQGSTTAQLQLKYLLQQGKGRVLTNPKIMVTNGQKSTIDLTSDYVKDVSSQLITNATGTSGAIAKTYNISKDEGLKIEMIPFISPEGYVALNLKPHFATVKQKIYSGSQQTGDQDLAATLLQRRDLELRNIRIKDGETLILGGLIKENESQQVTKIPILGDLPIVGSLFRSSTNDKSREELVIMLTPHIVYSAEEVNNIKNTNL